MTRPIAKRAIDELQRLEKRDAPAGGERSIAETLSDTYSLSFNREGPCTHTYQRLAWSIGRRCRQCTQCGCVLQVVEAPR